MAENEGKKEVEAEEHAKRLAAVLRRKKAEESTT